MSTHPRRVLLVTPQSREPNATLRLLSQLDDREFTTTSITGEKEALERLASGDCDACIIDLPMADAVLLLSEAHRLPIPLGSRNKKIVLPELRHQEKLSAVPQLLLS